jgi:hypothetical protein
VDGKRTVVGLHGVRHAGWPQIRFLRRATLFYLIYYSNLLRNMAIMAAILLTTAVIGAVIWRRRDLPL